LTYLLYRLALRAYHTGIQLAAIFNTKARQWVNGRNAWEEKLGSALKACTRKGPLIWIHCASLGEFEQGRPLLEALREKHPDYRILLSFFSPSGYELRKNYDKADIVCYLPIDSPRNARHWMELTKPVAVFFVKYEFWYDFLAEVKRHNIPLYLVSGIFRPSQLFFKPWGGLFREMLGFFSQLFVQNEDSRKLLQNIGIEQVTLTGDTRIDRVLAIQQHPKLFPLIDDFANDDPILVCGSSWPADELIIFDFWKKYLLPKGWKIIIAPHEIHTVHIYNLENKFSATATTLRYSEALKLDVATNLEQTRVLIIDNIGMLSQLYRYAKVAYIGGGFGKGIHNSLEAAVYNIPLCFGPKHKKFAEAQDLLKLEVAYEINSSESLCITFEHFDYHLIAQKSAAYIRAQQGASEVILQLTAKQFYN